MTLQRLTRVFKKHVTKLLDPDPAMTPEQVLEHYTDLFPELANATVSEPETVGNELVYTFEKPMVKTKGSFDYIREHYGVPAKRGGRVILDTDEGPRAGSITSASNYVHVRFDDSRHSVPVHPTDERLRYLPADPR